MPVGAPRGDKTCGASVTMSEGLKLRREAPFQQMEIFLLCVSAVGQIGGRKPCKLPL